MFFAAHKTYPQNTSYATHLMRHILCAFLSISNFMLLLYVLQCVVALFSGTDLDYVFNVVDKYLSVSDMTGI